MIEFLSWTVFNQYNTILYLHKTEIGVLPNSANTTTLLYNFSTKDNFFKAPCSQIFLIIWSISPFSGGWGVMVGVGGGGYQHRSPAISFEGRAVSGRVVLGRVVTWDELSRIRLKPATQRRY